MLSVFTTNPTVSFSFAGSSGRQRKMMKVPNGDPTENLVYKGSEPVIGTVDVSCPSGKKIDHQGIKVELIGQIELTNDRMSSPTKFATQVKVLEGPGQLSGTKTFPVEFSGEKPFESYSGLNVRLRYLLRVTVTRKYNNYSREIDFAVEIPQEGTDNESKGGGSHLVNSNSSLSNPIKMEVGINDCLHIEFEYDRDRYHLKDVILGKIYFLLVQVNMKYMELAVIRRESAGSSASSTYTDSENITKYELMDGAPIKGECVPIRLFLEPLDLTPTYRSVRNVFSVKYYLNLVLVDAEDRRYFKQNEITLWRSADDSNVSRSPAAANAGNASEETPVASL